MQARIALSFAALIGMSSAIGVPVAAGWPNNPVDAVPVCTDLATQERPAIVEDGTGGAYVAWTDYRAGTSVYLQRIRSDGSVAWQTDGIQVSTFCCSQNPVLATDGQGGVIVVWEDNRTGIAFELYAQRLDSTGTRLWGGGNPVPVVQAGGDQLSPRIVPDGSGGVIAVWEDFRFGPGNSDIYGQRVGSAGTRLWGPPGGVPVFSYPGNQGPPRLIADGTGGAVAAVAGIALMRLDGATGGPYSGPGSLWMFGPISIPMPGEWDFAPDGTGGAVMAHISAPAAVFFMRVTGTGYTPWGASPIGAIGGTDNLRVVSDGLGGMIVACNYTTSQGMFVWRITAGGTQGASSWPNITQFGMGLMNNLQLVPDGSNGALMTWESYSGFVPYPDLHANHVTSTGAFASGWAASGNDLSVAPITQYRPAACSDARGGMLVAWEDNRAGGPSDIYMQRIERYGQVGAPEPRIVSVRDVAGDQGGKVLLRWDASYLDRAPELRVGKYRVWRRVPGALATAAIARGARLMPAATGGDGESELRAAAEAGRRAFRSQATATGTEYWEWLAELGANGGSGYSYTAATTSDSTASSTPWTSFQVEAMDRTASSVAFWPSEPDSGYSVDNLAPATPAPFAAHYSGGTSSLHWGPNSEPDLAGYRLHRGLSAGFTPGPGNFVAELADTAYADAAGSPYYYKLAAVDVHGNLSGYALVYPTGAVGVGDRTELDFALGRPWPNPATREASFALTVPRGGRVSLRIVDHSGRMIRTLAAADLPPGEHAFGWDLRDDSGRPVPSGIYLVSAEAGGRRLGGRLTVIR